MTAADGRDAGACHSGREGEIHKPKFGCGHRAPGQYVSCQGVHCQLRKAAHMASLHCHCIISLPGASTSTCSCVWVAGCHLLAQFDDLDASGLLSRWLATALHQDHHLPPALALLQPTVTPV
jgi:hypothetical protein